MKMLSIKDFAEDQHVSYEAIRKQVSKYSDELQGHIVKKNRTQYLDEWAVEFLTERRRESPVVVMNMEQSEQIEELKAQVEILKTKLLQSQEQIIGLQQEVTKGLETQIRYTDLLEDSKAKEERLRGAEGQVADLKTENALLQKERDDALKEANSYERSLFGFYRKR